MLDAHDPEGGFTLPEVLGALIVMAIAITAIVAAMGSSIIASDFQRKIVTSDAIVRSYAERLTAAPYIDEATTTTGGYSPAGVNLDLANWPGYSASLVTVECWNGAEPAVFVPCSNDLGLQRITLRAQSTTDNTRSQQLQILKRRP